MSILGVIINSFLNLKMDHYGKHNRNVNNLPDSHNVALFVRNYVNVFARMEILKNYRMTLVFSSPSLCYVVFKLRNFDVELSSSFDVFDSSNPVGHSYHSISQITW